MLYPGELLIWRWLAFFLHQADRQVFSVVLPVWQSDLGLSDVPAGLIASFLTAALGLAAPLAGYGGDVLSRKWIVSGSLLAWSAATVKTRAQAMGVRPTSPYAGIIASGWLAGCLGQRFGLSLPDAGFSGVVCYQAASLSGVLLGGRLSDRLAPRRPSSRPESRAVALPLGTPPDAAGYQI